MRRTLFVALVFLWMMRVASMHGETNTAHAETNVEIISLYPGGGVVIKCNGNQIDPLPINNRYIAVLCYQLPRELLAPTDTPFPTPIPTITATTAALPSAETVTATPPQTALPVSTLSATPAPTIAPPPVPVTVETS